VTFVVNSLTRCPGLNHWTVSVTIGGNGHVIQTSPDEMQFDPLENPVETRGLILARLRSAAKEANAATFAQSKTAIEGKTFKL
jgi:hypothetical protein